MVENENISWCLLIDFQHDNDPAWKSNHIKVELPDEITYPFPNFNSCNVEVWESISNFNSVAFGPDQMLCYEDNFAYVAVS